MAPEKPLPYSDCFSSPEEYTSELLKFVRESDVFQILCGGVHILDFFTISKGLFHAALPEEWHPFLLDVDMMKFLDILVRDDLENFQYDGEVQPPESLMSYIQSIRKLSLSRRHATPKKPARLPRSVSIGMKPKKIHEVENFADFVQRLSDDVKEHNGDQISHYVDFGSGQNYLGRALASEPHNRHVVAVEGREHNVSAAKSFDLSSGLAVAPKLMRNKKLWLKIKEACGKEGLKDPETKARVIREIVGEEGLVNGAATNEEDDFRARSEVVGTYTAEEGKGFVQYISGRLDSGDLSDVISEIDQGNESAEKNRQLKLMAVSIHSCGNLSHYAIRSLIMNPDMRAIAIVGCCYNLLTEKLGPPTYKHLFLRPTLQAINGRVVRESDKHDPQGFPMSDRFSTYDGDGIRLNVTARMMACQALQNWTEKESESFFTRHFFRAVAQKMFLDRGVVHKIRHREIPADKTETPFDTSTSPVIIGSLPNSAYLSLKTYIRAAVGKVCNNTEFQEYADVMREKMGNITDEEIEVYEEAYRERRKELCVVWSMMAFSAIVVESLIVTDRWTWLKEQEEVDTAWVEPVFDFKQSPRNLVIVGIKK